jgi:hypothetical protein
MDESFPKNHRFYQVRSYLRYILLFSLLLSVASLIRTLPSTYGAGSIAGFSGTKLLELFPLYFSLAFAFLGLVLLETRFDSAVLNYGKKVSSLMRRLGGLNWFILAGIVLIFGLSVLFNYDLPIISKIPNFWILGHIALLGSLCLNGSGKFSHSHNLMVAFSIFGLILWVLNYIPDVSNYPLTLGWSETSRYYYSSLFFSRNVYDTHVPLSSFLPARYLLQSVPFIITNTPLWLHRLWLVLLWVVLTLAGGLALTKRIRPGNFLLKLGLTAWFVLFVFQGPVYFHLMLVAVIVLLGFNKNQLAKSMVYVIIASLWAGICRINWFPVAGALAVTLYILEVPQRDKKFWEYWAWPVLAVLLGVTTAIGSNALYVMISGHSLDGFLTSINSPLLSYRLFPNDAYGPGLLVSLIIAIFPLILIMFWRLLPNLRSWHKLRLSAMFSILAVFLGGGMIVSIKIGGGNNLHNLDAFLVLISVVSIYLLFNRFIPDDHSHYKRLETPIILLMLLGLIPIAFLLNNVRSYPTLDHKRAWDDINQIQSLIDELVPENGEVLFIHNRHLLTFNMIDGIDLITDYEKVYLMEMAMSDTMSYIDRFEHDIETQRFHMIITEPLYFNLKPMSEIFAEESNAWIVHVARPIGQSYQVIFESRKGAMSVMVPKGGD